MEIELEGVRTLRYDDGTPLHSASAIVRFGDGWLVVQDDATYAAWMRPDGTTKVRLLPPVEGHDAFSEAAATKLSKPDFEAACTVEWRRRPAALLLGSGSHAAAASGCACEP